MIYKLNTNLVPLFSGTYETAWDIYETDDSGQELNTQYDFKEFMRGIASEYQDHTQYIREELGAPWIKSIKFPGGYWSPREYNFNTDSLDMNVTVKFWQMLRYLKSLKDNTEFAQWLRDNYSSRDGFWSYTPDNYSDMLSAIINHTDEEDQAVGALIRWAGLQANPANFEYMGNIEGAIQEQWASNGWGGVNYWVECGECYERMTYRDGLYICTNPECKECTK